MGVTKRNQGRKRDRRMQTYLDAVKDVSGPHFRRNPFKEARKDNNLSMADITAAIGISKQALIRAEQGTYTEPPDRLLNFYLQVYGHDYIDMTLNYELFQKETRRRHNRLFGDMPNISYFLGVKAEHPLTILRYQWTLPATGAVGTPNNDFVFDEPMNLTEVSKLLCLNQSVVNYFSNKVNQQASVPQQFLEALRDSGYTISEINTFELAYQSHRNFMLNSKTLVKSLDEVSSNNKQYIKPDDFRLGIMEEMGELSG